METSWLRKESGLLVTEVTPGGWAGIAGLYRGDVLISANGARLADAKSFQEAMKSLVEARPPLVKLLVKRRSKTHFVLLEPDWDRLLPVNGEAEKEKPL
jgi:S1-C subfamily serine protease